MAGNIKGITVEIGGNTTKLSKAIADSEKKSRDLQSELKAVDRALKFNPDNVELISQKQEILNGIINETSDKLKTLKDAQEQVKRQFESGDLGADEYRAFQREIIETESKLETFKDKLKATEDGSDKLGDSIKKTGDESKNAGDGFTVMKGALADMVSNVLMSAVNMIGDLVGQLFELSEATEEYRQMQGKLAGSADTFGYSMEFANEKYKEFYKYTADDQMATNAITNLMGIGAETDTISKIAEGATAVWASYGDSIPLESLTESINESITVGKVTGTLADTINWCKTSNEGLNKALSGNKDAQKAFNDAIKEGLPVEDAFNEALAKITDEQERADVVAKFLNNTYGESKKKYDEMNGSILDANEAELKLKETQAQLGQTMEPVNTALTNMKSQALQAITPLVTTLAEKFTDLYVYLQKHPGVMKIVTAVVIALATAFGVLAGALAIQGLIAGVTKAIAFLNTTLLANPIVLITALIAGLVAGFIYLWKNCDSFREFWINLWKKIKTFFLNTWNSIKNFCTKTIPQIINNVVKWFKQLPSKIWTWLVNTVNRVKTWASNMKSRATTAGKNFVTAVVNFIKTLPSKIWTWLKNTANKVVTWGSDLATKGKQAGTKLLNAVVNKVKEIPGKIKTAGANIVTGLWNGINNKVTWLKNKIKGFVGNVTDWLKKFFKIKSPSRVMRDEIGRYIAEGIGVGIDENADKPLDALNKLGNDMVNADFTGANFNRRLGSTFRGAVAVGNNNDALLSKLDGIYERLNRMQIVLDTGTLVGETIDKIDSALAVNQTLKARGV